MQAISHEKALQQAQKKASALKKAGWTYKGLLKLYYEIIKKENGEEIFFRQIYEVKYCINQIVFSTYA